MRTGVICVSVLLIMVGLSGCKPYEIPEFQIIDTNETAYVVPLEGDISDQVAFNSEEQLEKHKVAAKRIQIPHRWVQTGRMWWTGEWIDMVRVVKVSRTPETREWSAGSHDESGNSSALWAESADGVGFSTGFTCTAFIAENDTSRFLYSYSGKTLASIIDTEVRARIQSQMAEFAASDEMDTLRSKKDEMIVAIRSDVIPYFDSKGITVTTLGQFGGFTYEDPKIGNAITSVFVAQQEKQITEAELAAQADRNTRLKLEGIGLAQKTIEVAKGEAEALRQIANATAEAAENPAFLEIKRLEVQQQLIEQWDGKYPLYMMNMDSGSDPSLLMTLPTPE